MIELSASKARIFRITHIDNVAWIIRYGLQSRNSPNQDPDFRNIGNPELISRRHATPVTIPPGGTLSDYVPFYFTPFSPMMLNIKTGRGGVPQLPLKELAIFATSLHWISNQGLPFVFSDRHACLKAVRFSSDLKDLNRIDWGPLQLRDFKKDPNNPAKTEKYQAEALVHTEVPMSAIQAIITYSPTEQARIQAEASAAGVAIQVLSKAGLYV
jgi:hypothetical protein